jgi:hypothetical protein
LVPAASGCGLWEPEYRDYTATGAVTAPVTTESAECKAALAEFTAQIEPGIDRTCVQCHEATTIAGTRLIAKNATNNRKALSGYAKGSADKLYNHYSQQNGEQHGGGAQGTALPKANVDAWMTKEALCK